VLQVLEPGDQADRFDRIRVRDVRRVAADGDAECVPPRSASALGGVPEQVLPGRRLQVPSIRVQDADGGGRYVDYMCSTDE
jgi:hypothetical protein